MAKHAWHTVQWCLHVLSKVLDVWISSLICLHEGSKLRHFDMETGGVNITYAYMVHLETAMESERERERHGAFSIYMHL